MSKRSKKRFLRSESKTASVDLAKHGISIDSNILIDVINDDPGTVNLFLTISQDPCSISVITYMEVLEGALRSSTFSGTEARFSKLLQNVDVLPVTQTVAQRCAHMRADLYRSGKRVRQRALDLLIAATAIEHNLTLVTHNQADYADIPGLILFRDP
jgi:tRNA(fMet)-specific endonuclease VapC